MRPKYKKKSIIVILGIIILQISTVHNLKNMSVSAYSESGEVSLFYLPNLSMNYMPSFPSLFGAAVVPINDYGGLGEMRNAGAYYLRRGPLLWKDIEPTPPEEGVDPSYEWDSIAVQAFDAEILNAKSVNMEPILIVGGAPDWAREDQINAGIDYTCAPIDEADLENFADFMVALVNRYSSPPYNISYFEVYNEPDIDPSFLPDTAVIDNGFGCWGDSEDPNGYYGGDYYGQMLSIVYPAVKEAQPDAQILVGGLLLDCDPINVCIEDNIVGSRFLEGIFHLHGVNNGGDYFDGISFHAYDYYFGNGKLGKFGNSSWNSRWDTTGPVITAKVNYIKHLLTKYGYDQDSKLLMNTESAVICPVDDPCDESLESSYELTKAYYVAQSYTVAFVDRLDANLWYSAIGWRNSGLLYEDLSHRHAYNAYKTSRKFLLNSQFDGPITDAEELFGYKFSEENWREVWVIWSRDGESHPFTLPSTPTSIVDALGNPIPVSSQLTIDVKPVYIEWVN